MAASATFALKAGVWFRRGRLVMVSPDSLGTACPLSGRNSTYRPVQISGASSILERVAVSHHVFKHPRTRATVVLPHPKKDLGRGLVRNIYQQAGWQRD